MVTFMANFVLNGEMLFEIAFAFFMKWTHDEGTLGTQI